MTTHTRNRAAAIGLAATLLLAGCSSGDSPDSEDSEAQGPATEAPADSGDEATDEQSTTEEAGGNATGARWPDPENVIAEDVFPAPNVDRAEVRVGIEGIIVTDETMELRLVLTPEEGADGIRVWDVLHEQASVSVRLIDRENLKEYSELRAASGGQAYQPSQEARLIAGQSLAFPIFYAPPEDDIDEIDVQLSSHLPVFEDVPLTFEK